MYNRKYMPLSVTYIFEAKIFSELINVYKRCSFGTKSVSMNIDKNTVNTEQKR